MARTPALIFGVLLVLVGLLGFTSNPLIGINALFAADAFLNVIHIVLGGFLLSIVFRSGRNAGLWLKVVGIVVLLSGLAGLFSVPASGGFLLGIAYTNGATNWFHFITGLVAFFVFGHRDSRSFGG